MESRFTSSFAAMIALFFVVASIGMTSTAFSSTLNLDPGESAVIQPNTPTTVVCANGPTAVDCTKAIAVYESRYKVCKNSYASSTCFNNEWGSFKTRSPECTVDAFEICNRTCVESMSSSTCYTNCR